MAKPIQGPQPAIIFSVRYVTAAAVKGKMGFKGFSKYTARDNATDLTNDVDLNQNKLENFGEADDLTQKPIDEADIRPFQKFIDYTARNTATYLDGKQATQVDPQQKLTPTFDQQKDHLTVEDTDKLRHNLDIAQKNNGTLWAGVFSYSTAFLIRNNLYDPKTEACDQQKIKAAVRHNMGDLLKANGLDKEGFWWGDIQFNTDHIHVHIGISELKPRPAQISYKHGRRVEKEARYKLTKSSMRAAKSRVFQDMIALGRPKDKNKKLDLEKRLGVPKATLREQLIATTQPNKLQALFISLPADKKLWRYRSNAKVMQPAKELAKKIVAGYLDGNPDYQEFRQILTELDQYNAAAFGQKTAGRTFDNKDQELRERLTNALFKACRELPKEQTKLTVDSIASHYDPASIEQNAAKIQGLKQIGIANLDYSQRAELRKRRVALNKQYAHLDYDGVKEKQENLQAILVRAVSNPAEDKVVKFLEKRYQNRKSLAELKLKPKWQRTDTETIQLEQLQAYFTGIEEIPANKLTTVLMAQQRQRQADEMTLNSSLEWRNLRPSLRMALANELNLSGTDKSLSQKQAEKLQGHQARLLRLKTILAKQGNVIPDKDLERYQRQITRLANRIKQQQGQTDKNKQPNADNKYNHQIPKDEKWFLKRQQQQGRHIIKQATRQVQQEVQQVRRTEFQKSRAQSAMVDQQRLIEREQRERER